MKILKNVILAILIIGVGYNLFTNNGIRTDVASYNHKIDSIQNIIDSVEKENVQLNGQIAHVNNEINKVEGNVTNVYKNINQIKNQTHEKVIAVNDYDVHDLIKFFSERYEIGHDTSTQRLDSTLKSTNSPISH